MKVRIQKNPDISLYTNAQSCYRNEGIFGFFKGMSLPLASISFLNSLSFIGNEFCKKLIGKRTDSEMNIFESTACGFFAGAVITPFTTPIELVKCKLQIQVENKNSAYFKGVNDLIYKTIKLNGIKGLFKGSVVTFLRETVGYAGQFGCYHYIKLLLCKSRNIHFDNLSEIDYIIAGGLSGAFAWLVSFPFDVLKTLIQTGKIINQDSVACSKNLLYVSENKNYKEKGLIFYEYESKYYDGGVISSMKHVYLLKGIKGFYIGFLPVVIISIIGNAVMFLVYEKIKLVFEKRLA